MLLAMAERYEAAALVDQVPTADPQHLDALKMPARRHIDAERPEQALLDLNSAWNGRTTDASGNSPARSGTRAFKVAWRLRGSETPNFHDTYGWLLTGRGDYQQALTYLEPAAAALTSDALTQFHLAKTYDALERWDEARAAFERAVEIAGPESDLPQIAEARTRISEIEAMPAVEAPPSGQ
jgi:Flp pilus assembly protein TadD